MAENYMKKLTKQEQKREALEAYEAIDKQRVEACKANDYSAWETCEATRAEALQAYDDRIDEIDKPLQVDKE